MRLLISIICLCSFSCVKLTNEEGKEQSFKGKELMVESLAQKANGLIAFYSMIMDDGSVIKCEGSAFEIVTRFNSLDVPFKIKVEGQYRFFILGSSIEGMSVYKINEFKLITPMVLTCYKPEVLNSK